MTPPIELDTYLFNPYSAAHILVGNDMGSTTGKPIAELAPEPVRLEPSI